MGLNVDEISVMVVIAFRFIPVMLEEANELMDAQASRGVEFENCSVLTKTKNDFTLLMPLFIGSIERSADLAMAMEARGSIGSKPDCKTQKDFLRSSQTDDREQTHKTLESGYFVS